MSRDVQGLLLALVLGSGFVGLYQINIPATAWAPTTAPADALQP